MRSRTAFRSLGWLPAFSSAAFLPLALACGQDQPPPVPRVVEIETLAARCHPQGGGGSEAFRDLLYLRDNPLPAAVPALAQVLRDHVGSNRINRFAAAQALSTIDTENARRVLETEVVHGDFDGRLAFDYAFHWEMAPDARDRFLLQYVLRDAGEAPSLKIRRVPDPQARASHLVFEVEVTNTATTTQEIMDPADRLGELLVFRAVGGHVARTDWPATCEHMGAWSVTLAPGESRTVRVDVEVMIASANRKGLDSEVGQTVGHANGYWYSLSGPGEYDVVARWTSSKGRSVSAPVRVTVPDVE